MAFPLCHLGACCSNVKDLKFFDHQTFYNIPVKSVWAEFVQVASQEICLNYCLYATGA